MAWPFSGNSGGNKSADQNLSEERLKTANGVEQVPFRTGNAQEEDAWTIRPVQHEPGSTASKCSQRCSVARTGPTPVRAACDGRHLS